MADEPKFKTHRVRGDHRALAKFLNGGGPIEYGLEEITFSGSNDEPAYTLIFTRFTAEYIRLKRRERRRRAKQKAAGSK